MWLDVISQNSCFTVVSNAFNRPSFVEFEFMNQSINTYNILETLPPLNGGERCSNIGSAVMTKAIPAFHFCR